LTVEVAPELAACINNALLLLRASGTYRLFIVRVAAAALVVYVVIGARSLCCDAVLAWSTCQAFYNQCVDL
jgi:hypothetical protein